MRTYVISVVDDRWRAVDVAQDEAGFDDLPEGHQCRGPIRTGPLNRVAAVELGTAERYPEAA